LESSGLNVYKECTSYVKQPDKHLFL